MSFINSNAKRTYRELSILIHLRHKNVLSIQDVFIDNIADIYLVSDLMGMDLSKLLSTKKLEEEYIEYFVFQIMVNTCLQLILMLHRPESSTSTLVTSFIGQSFI